MVRTVKAKDKEIWKHTSTLVTITQITEVKKMLHKVSLLTIRTARILANASFFFFLY